MAEELPIGQRGVYKRLEQLEEKGAVCSKRVGGSATAWWVEEE